MEDPAAFWKAVWDHCDILHDGQIDEVMTSNPMPRSRWFTGTRLDYAEHVLRRETDGDPALPMMRHGSELREMADMGWAETAGAARRLAPRLRELGVGPGDRVVAYMPNIPETVIAMLSSAAIGAVWSSAAPEFGAQTVIDRFSQIEPKLVFAVNGYRYGGKDFDWAGDLGRILPELPGAESLVMLDYLPAARRAPPFRERP